ncbi:hypothetical protein FRB91_009221 [Serendipita sp. 411]|nr:hypothetical protein FRB91_009221 [Serendipita sp. 411]
MLVNAQRVVGTLCLLPLIAGVYGFQEAGNNRLSNLRVRNNRRQLLPTPDHTTTTAATPSPTSTSTSTPPSTSSPPPPTSSSIPTSTPPSSTPSSSTSKPVLTSAIQTTNDEGDIVTEVVTVTPSSSSPSASATSGSSGSSEHTSSSKGTFIGLGVAGGIAVVALIGFIVWKRSQKKEFEEFENDDGNINWPMPKEQLHAPAAPSMMAATNATSSSVDLTRDPYSVPPLPAGSMMPYRDDPSGTAAAAYYDPYRGPVPHAFQSPPPSSDGHAQHMYGEAIPMSTYSSGRQSPGPNNMGGAYDDPYNRSRSPGPNMAYEDPYAAGRRSPGPGVALGMNDPLARAGTPTGHARTGTPTGIVAGVPPPRIGTPVGGGYGVPPPGLDIARTGTPQGMYGGGYGRASPAPPQAFATHQPPVDPYGRRTPNPYGP